ncbi:MAG TPA: lysophospholipid acyltransferase family protein [Candidatus Acidoferrum sp.]|nr:lysophospholipid acyltransferase family protein [Candidatus Acidoferrum sp.]
MKRLRALFRGIRNFCRFGWIVILAANDFVFGIRLRGKSSSLVARAAWLQRWSQRVLEDLNIRVERRGVPPAAGVLACNHLSYLDIIVLAAAQPVIFVAKNEIRHWPVFGWLARGAGTLFVRRDHKSDVAKFNDAFAAVVKEGVILGLFPEGTSTNSRQVLPFYSSLFEPAVQGRWPVSAARIGYALGDGSVENDICYWGTMTFFPHFLRLLTRGKVSAAVAYAPALAPGLDRKAMARQLHRQVEEMAGLVSKAAAIPDESGRRVDFVHRN